MLSVLLGNICHGENKIEADNDVLIKIVRLTREIM